MWFVLALSGCGGGADGTGYVIHLGAQPIGEERVVLRGDARDGEVSRRREYAFLLGEDPIRLSVATRATYRDGALVDRTRTVDGSEVPAERGGIPLEDALTLPGLLPPLPGVIVAPDGSGGLREIRLFEADGAVHWEGTGTSGVAWRDDLGLRAWRSAGLVVTRGDVAEAPLVDVLPTLTVPSPPFSAARRARKLTLAVTGNPPPEGPPAQRWTDGQLVIERPIPEEIPSLAVDSALPQGDPGLRAEAAAIVGDAPHRREAVARLVAAVYERFEHKPVPGEPGGLAALALGAGDCTEQADAFVALARAAGIEARRVDGLLLLPEGGAVGHAWAEVTYAPPWERVAVDPALGQPVADAGRVALADAGALRPSALAIVAVR